MPTVRARTLRRAAAIVGEPKALALQFDVKAEELTAWMAGTAAIPEEVFLRAVDIVTAHQVAEISGGHPDLSNPASKGSSQVG